MTIPQSHKPGPWYGHWRPRSKKCLKKKNPVCETMVWPLTLKKPGLEDRGTVTAEPGQKPEHWRPSSINKGKFWWMMDASMQVFHLVRQ